MIKLSFKIQIDWDSIFTQLAVFLCKRKAYVGYCIYCKIPPQEEIVEPLSKKQFYNFEAWKIFLSYMIYLKEKNIIDKPYFWYDAKWCLRQYFKPFFVFL